MRELIKIFNIFPVLLISVLMISCNQGGKKKSGFDSSVLSSTDTASLHFKEYEHNFGKIAEGEKVACVFTFENTGTGPLVIQSATTSCGCTVSKYDNKPVSPGGTGSVEVVFDSSGRNGIQTKTVTVRSNASVPVVLLKITGEVISSTNN
jgi:hypothetical protein